MPGFPDLIENLRELTKTIKEVTEGDLARLAIEAPAKVAPLRQRAQAITGLLLAGRLADFLRRLLTAAMVPISGSFSKSIFRGYGPLSTFSARIDLAYAFALIDEETHHDLHVIRDVRNNFAHPPEGEDFPTFESEKVLQMCRRFKQWSDGCDVGELFKERVVECARRMKSTLDKLDATKNSRKDDQGAATPSPSAPGAGPEQRA
jgi:hypothetical protein